MSDFTLELERLLRELPVRIEAALNARGSDFSVCARAAWRNQGPYLTGWWMGRLLDAASTTKQRRGDLDQRAQPQTRQPLSEARTSTTSTQAGARANEPRTLHKLGRVMQQLGSAVSQPSVPLSPSCLVLALQPNATRAFLPVARCMSQPPVFAISSGDDASAQLLVDAGMDFVALPWTLGGEFGKGATELFRASSARQLQSLVAEFPGLSQLEPNRNVQALVWPLRRQLLRAFGYAQSLDVLLGKVQPQSLAYITHRAVTDEVLRARSFAGQRIFFLQGIVPDLPALGTALEVDHAIVGSRLDESYLRRCGIDAQRTHILGYPDYDHLSSLDGATLRQELARLYPKSATKKLLVFCSQYRTSAFPDEARLAQLDCLREFAAQSPDWYVLIKPHPRLEQLSASWVAALPENVAVDTQFPTIRALAAADVGCTYWSTTALETVLLGTPLVQLNCTGLPDFFPVSQKMGLEVARDAHSLKRIAEARCDHRGRSVYEQARQAFFQEYEVVLDGRASERVAALLERTIGSPTC